MLGVCFLSHVRTAWLLSGLWGYMGNWTGLSTLKEPDIKGEMRDPFETRE
jgi:hypothetical protein